MERTSALFVMDPRKKGSVRFVQVYLNDGEYAVQSQTVAWQRFVRFVAEMDRLQAIVVDLFTR